MAGILPRILRYLLKRPAPTPIVALYLSVRWRCRVSPRARIDWPFRLRIGRGARLYACRIIVQGSVDIGANATVDEFALLDTQENGRIVIGRGSAIGPFLVIYGSGGVILGENCSIAGQSMIVSSTHTVGDTTMPIRAQGYSAKAILIEDDVWLGANCTVLPGAIIGRGTIVGANSLVRGTLPPMVVAVGSPARAIRQR